MCFSSVVIGTCGFHYGRQVCISMSLASICISFILGCVIFYEVVFCKSVTTLVLYNWLTFNNVKLHIGFIFDDLTSVMLLIILTISLLVHTYAVGYMSHDPFIVRFLCFLGIFTFCMVLLVTSDNFVQLFVGWEGVGLCSYLLINFWHTRIQANKAALKAMIMNRIADVFFILGIIVIIWTFKTADFLIIFSLVDYFKDVFTHLLYFKVKLLDLICLFLFIGAIGKSAQIGFHTWLPDAMEGPTPVSALLHAATMVTAGVFLLIRCSALFEYSIFYLNCIAVIGALTALFCSMIAVFQYDIKKIIAYSTCSQLGYMFFSCGISNYQIAMFHLFNHAFFKALLFLGAGCIISALMDEQDIRKMGALAKQIPLTYISILIGSLAITGFPFLAGFYSKDVVLEIAYTRFLIDGYFIYLMGVLAAFFTALYSIRLLVFVFFMSNNIFKINKLIQESNVIMLIPLFVLSLMTLIVGYVFSDLFLGWGTEFLQVSIFVLKTNFVYVDNEFLSPFLKNIPLLISFLGFFWGFIFIYKLKNIIKWKHSMYVVFWHLYKHLSFFFFFAGFFNFIYNFVFIEMYKTSYFFNTKIVDKGFLELIGPFGIYKFFFKLSYFLRNFTPHVIFFSVGYMFIGLFLFLSFIILKESLFIILENNVLLIFAMVIFFIEIEKKSI